MAMGCGVFAAMHTAAWSYRLPSTGVYEPPAAVAPKPEGGADAAAATAAAAPAADMTAAPAAAAAVPASGITLSDAMRSPHIYLLMAGSTGVCMTGLPWIQTGRFMMNDIFGAALGESTAVIAAGFPGAYTGP